jgi:hypothetical protein
MTDREEFETMAARLGSALDLVQRETTVGTSDNVMTLLCMADEAIKLLKQAARAAPALHIDDAECVMYDAMRAAHQRGPVTDDKVLLDELAKRGVVLTRAAPAQPEGKPK